MKTLNIYKLSQKQNNDYDTYDSCIVIAGNEEIARNTLPDIYSRRGWGKSWCSSPEYVTVELIGKAVKGSNVGVVLASFNAG